LAVTEHRKLRTHRRAIVHGVVGVGLLTAALAPGLTNRSSAGTVVAIPAPATTEKAGTDVTSEKAVLAGGCFWGVQAVFQHVNGVTNVLSGYAGGKKETADYYQVSSGTTGHAESVEIAFDPRVVNYGTILQIYFSVAHDPTQLNRQGPDWGTQYRSAIFAANDSQASIARAYIAQLDQARAFKHPIVTSVTPLEGFYPAESYHQDYATLHPDNPYIAYNDLPKVESLSHLFPQLYQPKPRLVSDAELVN
jgi:peptide-methionine (S)-S-oxide reductase